MSARKTLLMLPGFDGSGALFAPLAERLSDDFDCLPVSYDDHADAAGYSQQIARACPADVPVVVIAESFSGPLALGFLAAAPDNVIGGILSTTFARPPLALIISLAEKLRLASFTIPAVSEQILRWFCLNGVRDIALIKKITAVVRAVDGPTVQSRLTALTEMDATPALSDVTRPLLTLAARHDRIVRRRYMQAIRDSRAHARHDDVDGPHLLLQARPDECARLIRRFCDRLDNPADNPRNR